MSETQSQGLSFRYLATELLALILSAMAAWFISAGILGYPESTSRAISGLAAAVAVATLQGIRQTGRSAGYWAVVFLTMPCVWGMRSDFGPLAKWAWTVALLVAPPLACQIGRSVRRGASMPDRGREEESVS